jgi:hypothetical protein
VTGHMPPGATEPPPCEDRGQTRDAGRGGTHQELSRLGSTDPEHGSCRQLGLARRGCSWNDLRGIPACPRAQRLCKIGRAALAVTGDMKRVQP